MLHAGLDLSRKRLDVELVAEDGTRLPGTAAMPDVDSLRSLVRQVRACYDQPVRAAIESMTGARFIHDQQFGLAHQRPLVTRGWLRADALTRERPSWFPT